MMNDENWSESSHNDDFDPVAVLRIWQHDPPAHIRKVDRTAFFLEALAKGLSDKEIADYLNIKSSSINKRRRRHEKNNNPQENMSRATGGFSMTAVAQGNEKLDLPQIYRLAFGQIVRERREELGLTQEKLTRRLSYPRTLIRQIENASFTPPMDVLWKLAPALDTTPDALVSRIHHLALLMMQGYGE